MALVNAHLLASDGHAERGGYGSGRALIGALVCLARLLGALVAGLGPELGREDVGALRFLNVWDALRRCHGESPELQLELVRIAHLVLLFRPQLITESAPWARRVRAFLEEALLRLRHEYGNELRLAALRTLLLMAEKQGLEAAPEAGVRWGAQALLAHELAFRAAPLTGGRSRRSPHRASGRL
jgi:hypothetical protein